MILSQGNRRNSDQGRLSLTWHRGLLGSPRLRLHTRPPHPWQKTMSLPAPSPSSFSSSSTGYLLCNEPHRLRHLQRNLTSHLLLRPAFSLHNLPCCTGRLSGARVVPTVWPEQACACNHSQRIRTPRTSEHELVEENLSSCAFSRCAAVSSFIRFFSCSEREKRASLALESMLARAASCPVPTYPSPNISPPRRGGKWPPSR